MRAMTDEATRAFVRNNKFGVLGLADHGRAYALPLFYGYDGRDLYFHVHQGLKGQYARATAEACFTIVRVVTFDDWASVQAFGTLETVPQGPGSLVAQEALMRIPLPPEWGESTFGEPSRTPAASTYRLRVHRLAGRHSQTPGLAQGEIAMTGM